MSSDVPQEKRPRITISTVAAALGVAVSTVSNAYNRPDQLSRELRARILETAEQLGYAGPHPVARSLRQQRAGAVGVLFCERLSYAFADPAAVLVLDGIAGALEPLDIGLLLVPGRHDDTTTIQRALVDGFIIYSMQAIDPLVTAALHRRLPTVLIDQQMRPGVPSITVDDAAGARMAAAHLLGLGHRQIAIITDRLSASSVIGPSTLREQVEHAFFVTQLRFQGYRSAIEAAGLDWNRLPIYVCDNNSEADGALALRALLAGTPRPTALLALTDRLALGALAEAQRMGLRVPEDIAIVGFDDIPQAAQAHPPLSTIRQDHRAKGRLAGEALAALLQQQPAAEAPPLPVELIVRASSGAHADP